MRDQCADPVSGPAGGDAEGVFAPGHLGELTRHLPVELVDAVVEETRTVQRRMRRLPSRVGVYFVLALALFPSLAYLRVWDKLTAGLGTRPHPRPSEKALRDLRRRLGPAPLKAAFEVVAGPLAQPGTPGVLSALADRRLRRMQLGQGPRSRTQPGMAGQDRDSGGLGGLPDGIEISDLTIKIDKSKAGYFGVTGPDQRITLTRDAFRNEEQLARTLVHERYHVEQIRSGMGYPVDIADAGPWEAAAYAHEDAWWASIQGGQ